MPRTRNPLPISDQPDSPNVCRSDNGGTPLDFEQRIRTVVRLLAWQAAREVVEAANSPSERSETGSHE